LRFGLLAGLFSALSAGQVAADPLSSPWTGPSATYTPMMRPGSGASSPASASPAPLYQQSSTTGAAALAAPTVAAKAATPVSTGHRYVGVGSDVGMPDGLLLDLALAPTDWLRLHGALGTNSASLGYRGGVSFIPVGWGPSFNFEAGHCNIADTTSLLRTFFSVSSWMQPYVQQLGYTYLNAHLGFDYPIGGLTLFVHGGYTYLMGTIRAPQPVVITDAKTGNTMTVTISQDGDVRAHTLSAKLGFIYYFGGT
jgi:hypothetical protein